MKIIILVQACDDQPYFDLQKAQEETWDSIHVPGVETYFFISGEHTRLEGKKLYLECPEDYNMMHWRCKLAFDYLWGKEWDFIFRTNASSYVDKKLLVEFAKGLKSEKVYCGINGGDFASGAGVFLSRDVVKIIKNGLNPEPHPYEDVAIGQVLKSHGIGVTPGAKRYEVNHREKTIPKHYHYRCKSDNDDRRKDIQAFLKIFNQ